MPASNTSGYTDSQRYLSTRGGSYNLTFEEVVIKGLASDGGLFIPESIPTLPEAWGSVWPNLDFQTLTFKILSQYISPEEIPANDLKEIIQRSYSSFRVPEITPLGCLDEENQVYVLELFHGPTFAFKDVALQFLGNLFEYFLLRRNKGKRGAEREHLSIVGATSGDTGSAAIYGLRGKQDISVFMLHPKGKVSPIQEAQMTTVMDENVHNLALDGTFDDCQDYVKQLFGDEDINSTHRLAAVNSINWARILVQITYYFHSYSQLLKSGRFTPGQQVRFVVPTGNFGDILAGYFAKRMGLPVEKLVIATNANDILHRFSESGRYEKNAASEANGSGETNGSVLKDSSGGVKATLSPAMDILVSSNFERLLWFLAFQCYGKGSLEEQRKTASEHVKTWLSELKAKGGFDGGKEILEAAKADFESERVSDEETLATIKEVYATRTEAAKQAANTEGVEGVSKKGGYILDPHSAIGVCASYRSLKKAPAPQTHHISLATAHPAKFAHAVELALKDNPTFKFSDVLPPEFEGLEKLPRRVTDIYKKDDIAGVKEIIRSKVSQKQN